MADVYFIVDAEASQIQGGLELDQATVLADVQPTVQRDQSATGSDLDSSFKTITNQAVSQLDIPASATVLPLTFNLPPTLNFAGAQLWQQCQDLAYWQQQVTQLGAKAATDFGNASSGERTTYWLPIVLTAKGPLYGEVIGQALGTDQLDSLNYFQPVHLTDQWRQPLYRFAYRLLQATAAIPSVYLLQFGWQEQDLYFDRLWPFPNRAALASLGVQTPDLFTCYWRCVAGLPVTDLKILGDVKYRSLE
jgi:hypothetical protein